MRVLSFPNQKSLKNLANKTYSDKFLGSNDTIESYGIAGQATSDDEEAYYVNQEHFHGERNAFCLAKLALEAEAKKKEEEDLWATPPPRNLKK